MIMGKVAKGKGKTHSQNGKTAKCAEKQDNKSTDNFQKHDLKQLSMFLYQG